MSREVSDNAREGSPLGGNIAREDDDEPGRPSDEQRISGGFSQNRARDFSDVPAYSYYSEPFSRRISFGELGFGSVALALWFAVFAAGIFISTAEMRAAIKSPEVNQLLKLAYLGVICLSYTLTNVLFLTVLAAFVGCMSRRWQVGDGFETIPAEASSVDATRIYMAAVLRGFFLYLMFISGFMAVSTEKTVVETEFAQYIRIAGVTSILGFIVGYDPNLLLRLMHRILSLANLPLDRPGESPAERRRMNGDRPQILDVGPPRVVPR